MTLGSDIRGKQESTDKPDADCHADASVDTAPVPSVINGTLQGSDDKVLADFEPFRKKMERAGLPRQAIESFRHYYTMLHRGKTGYIPGSKALPVDDLPELEALDEAGAGLRESLEQTVVIKLNGGLGTTMGMDGPKSSIVVKDGLTFLDIVIRQVLSVRMRYGVRLPLVLMNSYNTQAEALETLQSYPELEQDVGWEFMQHKIPRIWKHDLSPVEWPSDQQLEWCPPGHGDIYLALQTSGMLDDLLAKGYRYALISNIDNLGATVDEKLLDYFARQELSFLMEAADRLPSDRKGGHLAQHPELGLILREVAQCLPEELDEFQDIQRYRYFNTNNLWVNLPKLASTLAEHDGLLGLPLIRNEKPVDPQQPDSEPVYQLETAMGQAIAVFPHAQAVCVPRTRFLPVKDTNDLLTIWSDAFELGDDYVVQQSRPDAEIPAVDLDPEYFGLFGQLQERFPNGAPSLANCTRFRVRGDVYFEEEFDCAGAVDIRHEGEEPLLYAP